MGQALTKYLSKKGYTVLPIRRILLDSAYSRELTQLLSQVEVVINLAGASLNKRWSTSYKKEIYESRIHTTRRLVETINHLPQKPSLFISASAVGYYPATGEYSEQDTTPGKGFLSEVCAAWEKEAEKISPEIRTVITRFGVVLDAKGGAFPEMTLPVHWKVAPVMGSGRQYLSWISLQDLLQVMYFIIQTPSSSSVFNLVSPTPTTYKEFTDALKKRYTTWFTVPVPSFLLRIAMGEASQIITDGPLIHSQHLLESGYQFTDKTVDEFLHAVN
ncbi:MAG: TIGR01777 family oxidoreductase [Bacteroides sp.]|nr:TIGR01777 family oxidoreductase [Bacteroides sp.]